jgi:hypothetical protein
MAKNWWRIEPPAHWVMQKIKTSHGITNSISLQIHEALITWVFGQLNASFMYN